jgi:hypothetical protein
MRVGGAHRITRETFGSDVSAAAALDGVIKTTDDDAPGGEQGH